MTNLGRRDLLKMAGLGAGAVAGLTLPLGESISTTDWISTSAKPAASGGCACLSRWPTPMATSTASTSSTRSPSGPRPRRCSTRARRRRRSSGTPRRRGPVLRPLIKVDQSTRVRLRVANALPTTHPTFGYEIATSVHLHGSASCRSTTGTPTT